MPDEKPTNEKKFVFNTEEMSLIQHSLMNDPEVLEAMKINRGNAKLNICLAIEEKIKDEK